jgi:hypothetical protein
MELTHGANRASIHASHEEAIQDMISAHSQGMDSPFTAASTTSPSSETVVLLTGSTGNLGAEILAELLENKAIAYVYTFNRPSSTKSVQRRHQERFKDRALNLNLLSSDKLVMLEGETFLQQLSLPDRVYSEVNI